MYTDGSGQRFNEFGTSWGTNPTATIAMQGGQQGLNTTTIVGYQQPYIPLTPPNVFDGLGNSWSQQAPAKAPQGFRPAFPGGSGVTPRSNAASLQPRSTSYGSSDHLFNFAEFARQSSLEIELERIDREHKRRIRQLTEDIEAYLSSRHTPATMRAGRISNTEMKKFSAEPAPDYRQLDQAQVDKLVRDHLVADELLPHGLLKRRGELAVRHGSMNAAKQRSNNTAKKEPDCNRLDREQVDKLITHHLVAGNPLPHELLERRNAFVEHQRSTTVLLDAMRVRKELDERREKTIMTFVLTTVASAILFGAVIQFHPSIKGDISRILPALGVRGG